MAAAADSPPPPPPPPPPSPSPSTAAPAQTKSDQINKPQPTNPAPPLATYVFQLPRENILRHPPPGNDAKCKKLRRASERRSRRRRCLNILFLLIIAAAAVSAAAFYFFHRFQPPSYTVTKIAVRGLNLTSAAAISPEFDVTVRAANPYRKIGIHYLKESSVNVYCDGDVLGHGALPEFYQPRKNVTVVRVTAADSSIFLGSAVKTELSNAQSRGRVPLVVTVEAPVKFEIGFFNSWVITAIVKCDVVLDKLSDKAQIVSKDCDTDLVLLA